MAGNSAPAISFVRQFGAMELEGEPQAEDLRQAGECILFHPIRPIALGAECIV
jgi:hypothetical protein